MYKALCYMIGEAGASKSSALIDSMRFDPESFRDDVSASIDMKKHREFLMRPCNCLVC